MSPLSCCRHLLPVLLALCLAVTSIPGKAFAASAAEVCQTADFATSCPESTPNPIFWIPPCPASGDPSLLIGEAFQASSDAEFSVSILYNRYPPAMPRQLQLIGSSGNDIVIGSPGTIDIINAGGGDNAYVVGGGTSRIAAEGSSVVPDLASGEVDRLNLVASAVDFVNIRPNGQGNPGSILVPRRNSSGELVYKNRLLLGTRRVVRGSDELKLTGRGRVTIGTCPTTTAMVGGALPLGMLGRFPAPLLAQEIPPQGTVEQTEDLFPGVPDLRGFTVDGLDMLVLSAEDFPGLSESQGPIPVDVVDTPESTAQQTFSLPGMATIFASSIKVPFVSSYPPKQPHAIKSKAPLVYFSKTGLLVLSKNSKPLGSESNPGRVIARLLTAEGAPLKLKAPTGRRFYPARFVLFTSSEQRPVSQPKTPSSPAKTTTYGATSF